MRHSNSNMWAPCAAGGTVLKLGTARHHQGLLRGIDNVDDIGCFALTELGFGEHWEFFNFVRSTADAVG
jgi:alkylation response protein AidB-like acyl-CoA dehydrogenase